MKSKYTPGPWCALEDESGAWDIIACSDSIAIVNRKADAILMQAAPELLAALEELCKWQNGPPLVTTEEEWEKAMKMSEAAIIKAGGEW